MAIKEVLHTDLAPAAVGPYSQAIAANGFVFTSGQVPIDPKEGKIVATTIEEQTEQVMKNLPEGAPARSCVEVAALPLGAKVEVEVVAVQG